MTSADAASVAELLGQLGYPSEAGSVSGRLARLATERHAGALVAEAGGRIVGFAAGQVVHAMHADEPLGLLLALVVDQSARGTGVGKALVKAVEGWARARGAVRIAVLTATYREAAHRFYEHLGYERTGYRYVRKLE